MTRDQLKLALALMGTAAVVSMGVVYEASTDNAATIAQSPKPCAIPDCWGGADGGFDDTVKVDCNFIGLLGLPDGGARWRGCNVGLKSLAVGTACLPVDCDSNPYARRQLEIADPTSDQLVEAKVYSAPDAKVSVDTVDVAQPADLKVP